MQSDDLGPRNKAVDQLTAEDRLRLHVHDDQTFAFTLDDAESLVPEIDALRAELAVKDAAIERLVAERDEAREALKPFAEFGGAWTKQSETDNSPFAAAADDQQLRIGASLVSFTVGDFRRAREALKDAP